MIYLVIPIFNEELNVPNLAKELLVFPFNEEIFFVFSDDGSTDKSVELLKLHFPSNNTVVLGDGINKGPGYAFNQAFNWVIEHSRNSADTLVTLEADCTSDVEILQTMLTINKLGYDLILASVYAQGGGFGTTSFLRKFISSIANLLYRFLFNVRVQTISSFYRVYSVSLLKRIKEKNGDCIKETGFICMLEILMKSISCNAKIIEVPMVLNSKKRIGKSKMKIIKTTLQYLNFLISTKLK